MNCLLLQRKNIFVMSFKLYHFDKLKCGVGRQFSTNYVSNYSFVSRNRFLNSKLLSRLQGNSFTIVRNVSNIKKINKSDIRRLLSLAKPEKWRLLGAIALLIVSSAVSMAVPFSLGKVLDIIYASEENTIHAREKLNKICIALIGIFTIGALCNFGRIYIMSTSGYRMTQALRMKVFSSIMKQEQGFFDSRATGELVNRLSADTQLVGNALSSNISDGLRSTFMVLAGSGMMIYMSPELALVGLAIVPPVAGIAVAYGRFVRKITRSVQDNLAAATCVAEEKLANIRTVKTFSKELTELKSYKDKIKSVLNLGYKESLARATFYAFNGFSGNVIIITVLYYGGVMVSDQTITVGNLSAFLLYAAYIGVSVGGLTSFYSELNKSLGAASRLWELIDRSPLVPSQGGRAPQAPPTGSISFSDISFSYPSRSSSDIFSHLRLEISPGQTVAVVGPSGAGKSTLGALLLRLYEPNEGKIMLDGVDIKELDPNWLRKSIGTVSQEPALFSCSIKENILYGADDPDSITEDQLIQATKESNIYDFIQSLPEKFNTQVGEKGVMLSGGQKQRIAIARALIKNPKILLLDEATSALDAHSEYLVREALQRVMKGRTVLTIAHRLSTIQSADTIAVLNNGKVVQTGTYDKLLTEEGEFKELVKRQTFRAAV